MSSGTGAPRAASQAATGRSSTTSRPCDPEARVRRQLDDQVQVARRAAGDAGVALAGEADPLPVDDPGRMFTS